MSNQLERKFRILLLKCINSGENLICRKMERYTHSQNGRMDGKGDGIGRDLIKEKDLSNFVSIWKPRLDFVLGKKMKL